MKRKTWIKILMMIFAVMVAMTGCGDEAVKVGYEKTDDVEKTPIVQDESVENISEAEEISGAGENMQIFFIDVGQGDCTFIDYGNYEALIDCGKAQYSEKVIKYIASYVDGDLDLVIATHPDADHIGGMDDIINYFQVDSVIDSGSVKNTLTCQAYVEAVEDEDNCQWSSDDDRVIYLDNSGNATIKIIETEDGDSDVNENSVVAQVNYNDVSVLLTGDMGVETERTYLNKFSKVDVLKAAHHGSAKSSSKAFLAKTSPDFVIISVGENNTYGHPDKEAMQRFSEAGATVYETMNNGTIIMNTDGKTYEFITGDTLTVSEPENNQTYSTGTSETGTSDTTYDTTSAAAAAVSTDSAYIGNKNTKKFHRSDCKYVGRMAEKNKVFFNNRNDAVNQGYDGCDVCNP